MDQNPQNTVTVTVQPGNDGPDAADWAETLAAAYDNYARRLGYGVARVTCGDGHRLTVTGDLALSAFAKEAGTHRLVRDSPHDEQGRRCSSFAVVRVDWEMPVRSYTCDPYTLAKDNRTGVETEDVHAVLAGNFDLLREP